MLSAFYQLKIVCPVALLNVNRMESVCSLKESESGNNYCKLKIVGRKRNKKKNNKLFPS